MMVSSNPLEGLVKVILILVLIGAVTGIVLGGAELFHPTDAQISLMRGQEEKESYDIAQMHDQRMNEISEEDQQARNQSNSQMQEITGNSLMNILVILSFFLGLGVAAYLIQIGHSKIVSARAQAHTLDQTLWSNDEWRWAQIYKARQREILNRLASRKYTGNGLYSPENTGEARIPASLEILDT